MCNVYVVNALEPPTSRHDLLANDAIGDQVNAQRTNLLVVFVMPETALNFSNVGRAEQQHQSARNPNTSSIGIRKLVIQDSFLETVLGLMEHSSVLKLFEQGVLVDADPHATDLVTISSDGIEYHNVSVHRPVVVTGRTNFLGRGSVLHGPSHSNNENGTILSHGCIFSAVHIFIGKHLVKLLGGQEGYFFGQTHLCSRMPLQKDVGIFFENEILGIRNDLPDRLDV
mmetsp:Transcript_5980/g.12319  ORF Transcript_5980/g.12319 Transcript_5980/m.12319 type:complete len:227 (+) Transcript_5980:98-778(+)